MVSMPISYEVKVLIAQTCPTLSSHGLEPTRLLCPWDSPGKNTGVDWHFLLQRIFLTQGSNLSLLADGFFISEPPRKMKVKVLVAQLCLTVGDSMDFSLPGSSVHGIFQARIPEWIAICYSRGSS